MPMGKYALLIIISSVLAVSALAKSLAHEGIYKKNNVNVTHIQYQTAQKKHHKQHNNTHKNNTMSPTALEVTKTLLDEHIHTVFLSRRYLCSNHTGSYEGHISQQDVLCYLEDNR